MASNTGTTAFPASLDDYARVGTGTFEDSAGYGHVDVTNQAQEAVEAIEVTVGTNSGTGVLTNFTAGDLAVRIDAGGTVQDTLQIDGGTIADAALIGTSQITGGSATNLALITPATDTIAEKTAATGVTIDSLLIKDGRVAGWDGWMPAEQSWAYASATTITVPSGAATKYKKGDKLKLTNTTVKYFYVVGVADTVLTVTGGTEYTVADAAITLNYFSHTENPMGFPAELSFTPTWDVSAGMDDGSGGQPTTTRAKFYIVGNECFVKIKGVGTKAATSNFVRYTAALLPASIDGETMMSGAGHCSAASPKSCHIKWAASGTYWGFIFDANVADNTAIAQLMGNYRFKF